MPTYAEEIAVVTDVDTFAPTVSSIPFGTWIDQMPTQAKYAHYNAKAHDGFAHWPTTVHVDGYDPCGLAQTAWYSANGSPDLMQQFITACRNRGKKVSIGYSVVDYTWEARTGTDETDNAAGYIAYIKAQLDEILAYDFDELIFDGWNWAMGYEEISFATLYDYCKAAKPNLLVSDNNHNHPSDNDIEIYENAYGLPAAGNTKPATYWDTIRKLASEWIWIESQDQSADALKTAATINSNLTTLASRTSTMLLNVTPDKAGVIPSAQVTILGQINVP